MSDDFTIYTINFDVDIVASETVTINLEDLASIGVATRSAGGLNDRHNLYFITVSVVDVALGHLVVVVQTVTNSPLEVNLSRWIGFNIIDVRPNGVFVPT